MNFSDFGINAVSNTNKTDHKELTFSERRKLEVIKNTCLFRNYSKKENEKNILPKISDEEIKSYSIPEIQTPENNSSRSIAVSLICLGITALFSACVLALVFYNLRIPRGYESHTYSKHTSKIEFKNKKGVF